MTAKERAEAFVKRYPTETWTDAKYMVRAIEIELIEAAQDKQTIPVSQIRPFRKLSPRPISLSPTVEGWV